MEQPRATGAGRQEQEVRVVTPPGQEGMERG